jgi:hypothetical protein
MPKRHKNRTKYKMSDFSSPSAAMVRRVTSSMLSHSRGFQSDMITRKLTYATNQSSSGAGIINTVITLAPNSYSDWSAFAGLYDEWRTLGFRIKFFCQQQNSLTVQSQPVIVVYDNDDNGTALTTLTQGMDYRVNKEFASVWDNQNFPTLTAYRSLEAADGNWSTTANPGAYPNSFKIYSTGLTASTQYLAFTIELVIQFRGST